MWVAFQGDLQDFFPHLLLNDSLAEDEILLSRNMAVGTSHL